MLDFLDVTWVDLSFFTQSRDLSSWLYLQRPVAKVENNGFGGSEPLLQVNISIPRIVGVFGKFHMASLENERNKIEKLILWIYDHRNDNEYSKAWLINSVVITPYANLDEVFVHVASEVQKKSGLLL